MVRDRAGADHRHSVRRLTDLLRAAVLRGDYRSGRLPTESALMAGEGVSRATVRLALSALRTERLIERTQGIGTHVVAPAVRLRFAEANGVVPPTVDSPLNRRMRPLLLDSSVLPTPASVADRLAVSPGTPCRRLEYVSLLGDEPVGLASNYVLAPEADRLAATPFLADWYAYLADAGVDVGDSELALSCGPADPPTAALLHLTPGWPLLRMEQVIRDQRGRPFDFAVIHSRGDRFLLTARVGRAAAGLRWLG